MEINFSKEAGVLKAAPKGPINTTTFQEFYDRVNDELEDSDKLELDFSEVDFVSSAGIRSVLRLAQKLKNNVTLLHANNEVKEVFVITKINRFIELVD